MSAMSQESDPLSLKACRAEIERRIAETDLSEEYKKLLENWEEWANYEDFDLLHVAALVMHGWIANANLVKQLTEDRK